MTWKITGAPGTGDDLLYSQAGTPTLDLRFASSKSLNDNVSGQNLIDFTRGGNGVGTYVGSDGLIKNSVVNLLLRSEEFTLPWVLGGVTSAENSAVAPNAAITADTATVTAGAINANLYQIANCSASTTYTFSFYVKLGTLAASDFRFAVRDDSNATFIAVDIAPTVSLDANQWKRVVYTFTTPAGCTSIRTYIYRYTSSLGGTFFIWGAQLEASTTPGEYVKTTSSISGAPRFDHDPATGESLGLLIEESRTNLLLRSEEFDNASWDKAAGTVNANATTAPSGTQTADKLIAATSPGTTGQVFQGVAIASGATVTGTVFVKDGGFDRVEIVLLSNNNTTPYGRATFNPITGVVTTAASSANGGTNASASVLPYGNGWYRLILTVTYPAVTVAGMRILSFNSDSAVGDGAKGVFLYGAQLEVGVFPTSYIPTTSATVTRNADVAQITGSNFSRWYSQSQGTLYGDAQTKHVIPATAFPVIADARISPTDIVQIGYVTESLAVGYVKAGNVDQAALYTNALGARRRRVAFGMQVNNFAVAANGGSIVSDASGTMPTNIVNIFIGSVAGSGQPLNGTIRRLAYFDRRLPNAVLQAITS